MTEPRQPDDHPAPETKGPHPHPSNGVPKEADHGEPTGTPESGRAKSENAAKP